MNSLSTRPTSPSVPAAAWTDPFAWLRRRPARAGDRPSRAHAASASDRDVEPAVDSLTAVRGVVVDVEDGGHSSGASSTARTFARSCTGVNAFGRTQFPARAAVAARRVSRLTRTCRARTSRAAAALVGELASAHLRHDDVGQHQLNWAGMPFRDPHRIGRPWGLGDRCGRQGGFRARRQKRHAEVATRGGDGSARSRQC